jgi:hypothetical protein
VLILNVLNLDALVHHIVGLGIPHWLSTVRTLIVAKLQPAHDTRSMIHMQAQTGHGVILRYCNNIMAGGMVSNLLTTAAAEAQQVD